MREIDRLMADELGVSLVRMMENAGRSLAGVARLALGGEIGGERVLVLVGPGGNGGGGLVAARHLLAAGADVEVRLSHPPEALAPVTAEQLAIAQRIGIAVGLGTADDREEPALVLDCLLGYGQQGAPRGQTASLIEQSAGRRVLALDVPSGLELETGILHAPHIRAEATLTLACPKEGLRAAGVREAVGTLYVADISVPPLVYRSLEVPYATPFGRGPVVRIATGSRRKART